jgi:hypothetical protein
MISAVFDTDDLVAAIQSLSSNLGRAVSRGMNATTVRIARNAKILGGQRFQDQTGALRNSIESEPPTGSLRAGTLTGWVGMAASHNFHFYGLSQEYGTRNGVTEKRFMRDAMDAETGDLIEDAMAQAFRDAGFEVTRS